MAEPQLREIGENEIVIYQAVSGPGYEGGAFHPIHGEDVDESVGVWIPDGKVIWCQGEQWVFFARQPDNPPFNANVLTLDLLQHGDKISS